MDHGCTAGITQTSARPTTRTSAPSSRSGTGCSAPHFFRRMVAARPGATASARAYIPRPSQSPTSFITPIRSCRRLVNRSPLLWRHDAGAQGPPRRHLGRVLQPHDARRLAAACARGARGAVVGGGPRRRARAALAPGDAASARLPLHAAAARRVSAAVGVRVLAGDRRAFPPARRAGLRCAHPPIRLRGVRDAFARRVVQRHAECAVFGADAGGLFLLLSPADRRAARSLRRRPADRDARRGAADRGHLPGLLYRVYCVPDDRPAARSRSLAATDRTWMVLSLE